MKPQVTIARARHGLPVAKVNNLVGHLRKLRSLRKEQKTVTPQILCNLILELLGHSNFNKPVQIGRAKYRTSNT